MGLYSPLGRDPDPNPPTLTLTTQAASAALEPPNPSLAPSARPLSAEGGEWEKVGENWYDKNRGLPTLFAEGPKAAKKAVRRAALGAPKKTESRAPSCHWAGGLLYTSMQLKLTVKLRSRSFCLRDQSQVQLLPRETHRQGGRAYEAIATA